MGEIEDKIKHWFNRIYRNHRWVYWVVFFVGLALIVIVGYLIVIGLLPDHKGTTVEELSVNLLATIIGLLVAYVLYRVIFLWAHRNEDKNKVSYSNVDMWKQYGTNYRQQFTMHDNNIFTVYCERLLLMTPKTTLKVEDDPEDFFELDPFIKSQFFNLIEAHAMSDTTNSITVRLKQVIAPEGSDEVTIKTMRSTYLAHMLTNRALDYELKPGITIRSLFENTNCLIPPQRSRMSNHLGVNALVFLRDGELLLPERGKKATVAKGKITASVATRIKMDNKSYFKNEYVSKMTEDYILQGCIRDSIAGAIMVDKGWLEKEDTVRECQRVKDPSLRKFMDIKFLGLSRDIYEGGKPTLFYEVHLDIDLFSYHAQRMSYQSGQVSDRLKRAQLEREGYVYKDKEQIDEVKTIHVVEWQSVTMGQVCDRSDYLPDAVLSYESPLVFDAYLLPDDEVMASSTVEDVSVAKAMLVKKRMSKAFEQNLIANFWFLKGCPAANPSRVRT